MIHQTPTIISWPTASAITYGQTLADSALTGGSASVAGSFAFTEPETIPTGGQYPASVTFTPTNTPTYDPVIGTIYVFVAPSSGSAYTWPDTLPYPMVGSKGSIDESAIVSQTMDGGPPKLRMRYTAISHIESCNLILTSEQLSILLDFARQIRFVLPFNFNNLAFDESGLWRFETYPDWTLSVGGVAGVSNGYYFPEAGTQRKFSVSFSLARVFSV